MSVSMFGQLDEVKVDGNYFFKFNSQKKLDNVVKVLSINSPDTLKTIQVRNYVASNTYNKEKEAIKVINVSKDSVEYYLKSDTSTIKTVLKMTVEEFRDEMAVYYDRIEWKVGFFAVPFKLRFNDFEFESDISLGTNLSLKYRINRTREDGFALEPLLGLGITKVNLDEFNSLIDAPGSTSAFTINSGLLFHINSKVNFGLFYGADFLAKRDNSKYDWKHNGNGWLGVGLNITFSETKKNDGDLNN